MFEIIIISISQLIFPLSFIYPNEHNINPIYMNLSRGFITVITHLFILYFFGISFDLPSAGDVKVMLVRGTIITLQQLVHAGMFYVLSFSVLSTLAVTGPLFVFIIDYFLYNVSINRKQFLGIAFGVIGVIITINGDVIMTLID
jgi:drug/metabolite transporter (DMT)-like permease